MLQGIVFVDVLPLVECRERVRWVKNHYAPDFNVAESPGDADPEIWSLGTRPGYGRQFCMWKGEIRKADMSTVRFKKFGFSYVEITITGVVREKAEFSTRGLAHLQTLFWTDRSWEVKKYERNFMPEFRIYFSFYEAPVAALFKMRFE
jgi:hypothetical protein